MPKQSWLEGNTATVATYRAGALEVAEVAIDAATHGLLSNDTDQAVARAVVEALAEWGMVPLDLAEPPERFPKLIAAAVQLGPNALAVLEEIADRLAKGASMGDFDNGRDMARESFEEMLDRLVYEIVRRQTDAKRKPSAWHVTFPSGDVGCVPAERFVQLDGGRVYFNVHDARVASLDDHPVKYQAVVKAVPLYADSVRLTG